MKNSPMFFYWLLATALKTFRLHVGIGRREFDVLFATCDVDGQAPSDVLCAVECGVNPPLAGRDGDSGLTVLVEFYLLRLARAHSPVDEILEADTGPPLVEILAPRRLHIDGIKLDGKTNAFHRIAGRSSQSNAEQRLVARIVVRAALLFWWQAAIDAPTRTGQPDEQRGLQRKRD